MPFDSESNHEDIIVICEHVKTVNQAGCLSERKKHFRIDTIRYSTFRKVAN